MAWRRLLWRSPSWMFLVVVCMSTSVYMTQRVRIFLQIQAPLDVPAISDKLRHAIGGLAETMGDAMAIFAPNANSYRRLIPGNFAPLTPNWGYNHRDVALRVPVSGHEGLQS